MMERMPFFFLGLVFSVLPLLSCAVDVCNATKLIELFRNMDESNASISIDLCGDLNFSDTELKIPLGAGDPPVNFSGVLDGHGHKITDITMDLQKGSKFAHAGLFYGLKNAEVKNLVIDSSCSFVGTETAGALCVTVLGSLKVTNVTNKATVGGKTSVGGFAAVVGAQQSFLEFEDCVNDANVSGGRGSVSGNDNPAVGGFVGSIQSTQNLNVTFTNCINNGTIKSEREPSSESENGLGGFVGVFIGNFFPNVSLESCVNSGDVKGAFNAGGFLGLVATSNSALHTINIHNCTNNGAVQSTKYAAGIVGFVGSCSSCPVTLVVVSSANNGNISADEKSVCGLFCSKESSVKSTVENSINRGSVSGHDAFGIANMVNISFNVVSMGDVNGSGKKCSLWNGVASMGCVYSLEPCDKTCYGVNPLFLTKKEEEGLNLKVKRCILRTN